MTMDRHGDYAPDKGKSKQRIDGITALIMALDGVMKDAEAPSIYDTRGVLSI
jgi:phage terminase large subunit-like protein